MTQKKQDFIIHRKEHTTKFQDGEILRRSWK